MTYEKIKESLSNPIFVNRPKSKITIIDKKGASITHCAYKYFNID